MTHVVSITATERELLALTSAGQLWRRNHATGIWSAVMLPPDCEVVLEEPIFANMEPQTAKSHPPLKSTR